MRPTACVLLVSLVLFASCATNPLSIPPAPHPLPSRPKPSPDSPLVAESRPAAVPRDFAVPGVGEPWREGDALAFSLEFENCGQRQDFWLLVEVLEGPPESGGRFRKASVRTTLLDKDGNELGTAKRRWNPATIITPSQELHAAYSEIVSAAVGGAEPDHVQEMIDAEMTEDSPFDATRRAWFNEMKRTMAPKCVREKLKEPAITSSIGSISVLDLVMAALAPFEVLVDVNRLKDEQAGVADFEDIPVSRPIRVPFVATIGGAVQFRFAITLTAPEPPYALAGGVLEIAGVNEACGERRVLIRLASAKRGPTPESRPSPE